LVESATGLQRGRACMVGDRLDTDILFGNSGGLKATLLVLTGVSSVADAERFPEGDHHRPTHVISSFGALGPLIREAIKMQ
jgi:ribonucleotide monophosphatase NagD (HAD superfamily)